MGCHVSSATIRRRLPGSTAIYYGVFSCFAHKGSVSSREEDYAETFAGGRGENACRDTISVLDAPCFHEGRLKVDVRRSSLDYSKIFGGGAVDGFAASYEKEVGPGVCKQEASDLDIRAEKGGGREMDRAPALKKEKEMKPRSD